MKSALDSVNRSQSQNTAGPQSSPTRLERDWLRTVCLDAGADDVGFVTIEREELADQKAYILNALSGTKALISYVKKMNRDPIRSSSRSIANLEFHHVGDEVNEVGRRIVTALQDRGVRALNPAMGFPMEMQRFPGRIWDVAHKPVAVAAGLGRMGIHRNVIHPKFGNFILLGTILVAAEVSAEDAPIEYNPCLGCKLCVAACPTAAIGADGSFNFSACYTHNYREFMGGFTDWVENVAGSKDAKVYRQRVTDAESASMWQSLSYGANYKAAYCMAVCPAGDDVIGPYQRGKAAFKQEILRPLQEKAEAVYVVAGSDAEAHVAKRFPHKSARRVNSGLRPTSIQSFLDGLSLVFQRDQTKGRRETYHFTFTGEEPQEATVIVDNRTLHVLEGRQGECRVSVKADSRVWIRFLRKDVSLFRALITGKVRIKGDPRLMRFFQRCFPV